MSNISVGGQAVIEGVMMQSKRQKSYCRKKKQWKNSVKKE